MSTINLDKQQLRDKGIAAEKYFCKDHYLNIRRAFPEKVLDGMHVSSHLQYNSGDGVVMYKKEYQLPELVWMDFKYTEKHDPSEATQFMLSAACYDELKKYAGSILIVYCVATEVLTIIEIENATGEYEEQYGEQKFVIKNLRDLNVYHRAWPLDDEKSL